MPRARATSHGPARATYDYGKRRSGESHGVVLTKAHVVRLILDLVGYTPDRDLTQLRLLDPACGHGAFVAEALGRLITAARRFERQPQELAEALCAFDVDPGHVAQTRRTLTRVLEAHDVKPKQARALLDSWVEHADFLLCDRDRDPRPTFDFIVGNPPYIRIEQLAPQLQAVYRARYATLFDRADLYVAFIERSLSLLTETGLVSFICADRWTLNKYGAPLRALIARNYSIRTYVDLHRACPFESEVVAYPSIFVFGRGRTSQVQVARLLSASSEECAQLTRALTQRASTTRVETYDTWFDADQPWVLSSPEQLAALRALEGAFETLEADARVGIGVATGNDAVYIVDKQRGRLPDIEPSRLVPLVMRADLVGGKLSDKPQTEPSVIARYVINTFESNGGLVDLDRYPKLRRYLLQHEAAIKRRYVARRNPKGWYRTIDRVYPELVTTPKLLIPDIADANAVVYDAGIYHPHHNLYYVTSERWDLEVLGGLLSSRVALFFVWSYAVKMRGGYLRFQAQYLRRIRLPAPDSLDRTLASAIRRAFRARDFETLDALALRAYGLEGLPRFDFVDTRR